MRLFKYSVSFKPGGLGAVKIIQGMVQVNPDVWSDEHIAKVILKELYNNDPRYYNVVLSQIPILG